MSNTRPSSIPSRWATNSGVRETPTTGLKASGFAAPQLVPDGIHNWLWGVLSDWTWWLYQAQKDIVIAPGMTFWGENGSTQAGGLGAARGGSNSIIPTDGSVVVHANTEASAVAWAGFPAVYYAGAAPGSVTIDVSDISGTVTVDVLLLDAAGNVVPYLSGNLTSTGEKELTASTDPGDGAQGTGTSSQVLDGWVSIRVTVTPDGTSDYIVFNALTISY